ncbi:putative senescence regulator S40 [Medicago truncatula]|uniref:Senescence regulator n=1 Tax=Medicago truncatula TaxID=3880 RepID=A0A072V5G6_MEDTR|nr:uncharacterized protein LOC25486167 [Medicago truncatula]KEH36866.1 senescence regulator [Medicago truncatula]RHN72513.1 putative senescence regulator S40 [Medicago truncatula]
MADWGVIKNKNTSFVEEDQDFDEEDVWGDFGSKKIKRASKDFSSSSSSACRKNIPKANTLPFVVCDDPFVKGSSAPMNIPDWSKVYGKNSKNGGLHDDEDGDEDGDMVPPHEWIARKLARSQISSFSVCEGMGRTLKGRDLSKVRNAILTKTGFIE